MITCDAATTVVSPGFKVARTVMTAVRTAGVSADDDDDDADGDDDDDSAGWLRK